MNLSVHVLFSKLTVNLCKAFVLIAGILTTYIRWDWCSTLSSFCTIPFSHFLFLLSLTHLCLCLSVAFSHIQSPNFWITYNPGVLDLSFALYFSVVCCNNVYTCGFSIHAVDVVIYSVHFYQRLLSWKTLWAIGLYQLLNVNYHRNVVWLDAVVFCLEIRPGCEWPLPLEGWIVKAVADAGFWKGGFKLGGARCMHRKHVV